MWVFGGNLTSLRSSAAGCGSLTAALAMGGELWQTSSEVYNGVAWAPSADMITGKEDLSGCGVIPAALAFGGWNPSLGILPTTEHFNGVAWFPGGDQMVGRQFGGGCGSEFAALSFGGFNIDYEVITEEYNGVAWSSGGDLLVGREGCAGCGTQIAALAVSGLGSAGFCAQTEEYNGTVWALGGDIILPRSYLGACGSQSAALSFGGWVYGSYLKNTEKYNGIAWVATTDLLQERYVLSAAGTSAAGLAIGGKFLYGSLGSTEHFLDITEVVAKIGSETDLDVEYEIRGAANLDLNGIQSESNLAEVPNSVRSRAFWLLQSCCESVIDGETEADKTLHKCPWYQAPSGAFYVKQEGQYYHSFFFEENQFAHIATVNPGGIDIRYATDCQWAYDQHNNHLAILARGQMAIHIYDLSSGIEDRIYTHVAEEFEQAVGLAFSNGRIDVMIPTIVDNPRHSPKFYLENESINFECKFPLFYSFNIDGSGISAPLKFCNAVIQSSTVLDDSCFIQGSVDLLPASSSVILSQVELVAPHIVHAKIELAENCFAKSEVNLSQDWLMKTDVDLFDQPDAVFSEIDLLDTSDEVLSETILTAETIDLCLSETLLNEIDPSAFCRSEAELQNNLYTTACRYSALDDYLLIGLYSYLRTGFNVKRDNSFYLILLDRTTFECIWSANLRTEIVTGTSRYDGLFWEEINQDGFTRFFTEGKFELQLFDAFGDIRIGLARYGYAYAPEESLVGVLEEFDINLSDRKNIGMLTGGATCPMGLIFKKRDYYDPLVPTGNKEFICYALSVDNFGKAAAMDLLKVFQRDEVDTDYDYFTGDVYVLSTTSWLIAHTEEFNYLYATSAVNLNVELEFVPSEVLLLAAPIPTNISSVLGSVDLDECFGQLTQSQVALADDNLILSKVFCEDYLVSSSVELIGNTGICFYSRIIGSIRDTLATSSTHNPSLSIVSVDDNLTIYNCYSINSDIYLEAKPAISGRKMFYLTTDQHMHCIDIYTYKEYYDIELEKECKVESPYYHFTYLPDTSEVIYQPLIALNGMIFYLSWYETVGGDVYNGISYVFDDNLTQGFIPASEILSEYSVLVSLATDGIYLYVLGYKTETGGLWLIKLNAIMTKIEELILLQGRFHIRKWLQSGAALRYNLQFSVWDAINDQFIISIASVAGMSYGKSHVSEFGYGPVIYGSDGSEKWWKNDQPGGVVLTTLPDMPVVYLVYCQNGDFKLLSPAGADLGITAVLSGGPQITTRLADVQEQWIENYVLSKAILIASEEDQDNPFPDIPGPTQVPRVQRFIA